MKQLVAFCWLPCEVILDSARIEQHKREELFRSIVIGTAVVWEKHESLWKGFCLCHCCSDCMERAELPC